MKKGAVTGEIALARPFAFGNSWIAEMLVVSIVLPLLASCAVSDNPLSEPGRAKLDPRLVGTWRLKGWDAYYHVSPTGGKVPEGMLIGVSSRPYKGTEPEHVVLAFPAVIGDSAFLNLAVVKKEDQLNVLDGKRWKPTMIGSYFIVRYTLSHDVLKIQLMDAVAVRQAIEKGKIKGTVAKETHELNVPELASVLGDVLREPIQAVITDTSDNLRRLVASDRTLFVKEEIVLERVK